MSSDVALNSGASKIPLIAGISLELMLLTYCSDTNKGTANHSCIVKRHKIGQSAAKLLKKLSRTFNDYLKRVGYSVVTVFEKRDFSSSFIICKYKTQCS
jgi:hypothetical protein